MWQKELICQVRDYTVGMRISIMMQREGFFHVDVRVNDKISFVSSETKCQGLLVLHTLHCMKKQRTS